LGDVGQRSESDKNAKLFIDILLSCSEYENFVEMMRAYKKDI